MTESEFFDKLTAFLEDVVFYDDSEYKRKGAYELVKEIPNQRVRTEVVTGAYVSIEAPAKPKAKKVGE
jgi:hypothetical protein